jgi:hypothetical protein
MSVEWTKEDLQLLRDQFQTADSLEALASKLGRTVKSVTVKASRLGLARMDFWSADDDSILSEAYYESPLDDVAARLNRSVKAIVSRAGVLGLKRNPRARFSSKSRSNAKCGRGVLWTEEQLETLKAEYAATPDLRTLSVKLGKTIRALCKRAGDLGLKRDGEKRAYNREWTDSETLIFKAEYPNVDLTSLASKLGRTKKAIKSRAVIESVVRCEAVIALQSRSHNINEDYFKVWSGDMAYVLGLICTDGNLCSSSNAVSICQHSNDRYILEDIMRSMDGDYDVKYDNRITNGKVVRMSSVSFSSYKLHRDLIALGLTPAKSLTLKCPAVPSEFVADFLRGVLDGDGTVSASRTMMRIATASKDFADGINAMFASLGVESKIYDAAYMYNGSKHAFYNVTVLKKASIKRIYGLMYREASLYLKRKKQRFEDMGVLDPDFEIKCKERMRSIVGLANGVVVKSFASAKDAKKEYPNLYRALKSGLAYRGFIWKYADKPTNNTSI